MSRKEIFMDKETKDEIIKKELEKEKNKDYLTEILFYKLENLFRSKQSFEALILSGDLRNMLYCRSQVEEIKDVIISFIDEYKTQVIDRLSRPEHYEKLKKAKEKEEQEFCEKLSENLKRQKNN